MHRFACSILLACLPLAAAAQEAPLTAFVDVNVVPMDRERVLRRQTVIVRGDVIETVGDANRVAVPPGARRVDGGGSTWLIPGLADMHTHLASGEDAALHVAYGVTTIMQLGGDGRLEPIAALRALLSGGTAPQVFFAFMIDGPQPSSGGWPVHSVDEARFAVRVAKDRGYDFVKIYNGPSAADFDAIVDEARRVGLPVIGHGVRSVGLPAGLFEGQVMVAHAEEFFYTTFASQPDDSRIAAIADETFRSGAYVTANLSTWEAMARQWGKPEGLAQIWADPLVAYMSPYSRLMWAQPRRDYTRQPGDLTSGLTFLQRFVKELSDRGVPLLAGTDNPVIPGLVPGQAINVELRTLTDSGLTPFQALSAATRTAGEFIVKYVPNAQPFGVVAAGMRADLVLVAANPLESLATLDAPLGVMARGRWKPAAELKAELEANKARLEATLDTIH